MVGEIEILVPPERETTKYTKHTKEVLFVYLVYFVVKKSGVTLF